MRIKDSLQGRLKDYYYWVGPNGRRWAPKNSAATGERGGRRFQKKLLGVLYYNNIGYFFSKILFFNKVKIFRNFQLVLP